MKTMNAKQNFERVVILEQRIKVVSDETIK